MTLLRVFIAAFLAVSHPVPATPAFGQVFARDGDSASYFPEPLIFYNLTREDFTAKLLEHRNANKHASSNSVHLHKRAPLGYEYRNAFPEQELLEERNKLCDARFPDLTHRVASGFCRPEYPQILRVNCRKIEGVRDGAKVEVHDRCNPGHVCDSSRTVWNFLGRQVKMPDCRQALETNEIVSETADAVPAYQGHQSIPGPSQDTPEEPTEPKWSPSALDSIDTFWEIDDEHNLGLTGQWEYNGHYKNGQEFSSRSFGLTHTWSCIGCPSGILYFVIYGTKAKALGSTFT